MPDLPTEPMTIVGLTVDSYKRIRAATLKPSPTGMIPVRGKNGTGKSSLIGSIAETLGIEKSKLPITEGEHAADSELDLGEIVVRKKWTRDSGGRAKAKLVVETADGVPYKSPAGVLANLTGRFADPVAFLGDDPADQVKTVLEVMGLDGPLAKLEAKAAEHYERRRDLGREADRTRKVYEGAEALCRDLPPMQPAGRTIEVLTAELTAGEEANRLLDDVVRSKEAAIADGVRAKGEIEELQAKIKEWEAALEESRERWKVADANEKATSRIDLDPVRAEIAGYEATRENQQKREALVEARNASEIAAGARNDEEEKLEEVRTAISKLLAEAPFPVEGMSYDAEAKALAIGGIPFSQASQAERLKIAAAVAMAGEPKIKVLFARDASLFDTESLKVLADAAEERGFQFWMEIVDEPDPETGERRSGIWIEDGEAEEVRGDS